jgi:hypothetical protein
VCSPLSSRFRQLDRLDEIVPKDWGTEWHAGARKIVRQEHRV